jgi:hypothetical protein
VQKGKDICDRVCGGGKDRVRSWVATGNNLLNANDIKEGMEHAGGLQNMKVAVAEIMPGAGMHIFKEKPLSFLIFSLFQGSLGKTNVPNISLIRSIQYEQKNMKVFKASGIGSGLVIPYKKMDFQTNMRVTSPFTIPINDQMPSAIPKKYAILSQLVTFLIYKIGELIGSTTTYLCVL